jgi:hypothetical protein
VIGPANSHVYFDEHVEVIEAKLGHLPDLRIDLVAHFPTGVLEEPCQAHLKIAFALARAACSISCFFHA